MANALQEAAFDRGLAPSWQSSRGISEGNGILIKEKVFMIASLGRLHPLNKTGEKFFFDSDLTFINEKLFIVISVLGKKALPPLVYVLEKSLLCYAIS